MLIQASERFTSCPAFGAISRSVWGRIHDLLDGTAVKAGLGRIIIIIIGPTLRGDGGIRFAHERSRC
ncbi:MULTISPECIES: hypothetical protein [Mesorhizobium]|uniref:hypothetical protein n=1 Tax=Mesorhizobium TaxID=68287 RepID=UPI0007ED9637|nr:MULTISPECIES: hypothetical protein [Mesorhizobium]PBB52117.1 hypothetical protein CK223_31390 [Mesorhizobium loti]QIA25336.1 hypothetical protein A9K68_028965 [Mesorhizobium sp. AA22]